MFAKYGDPTSNIISSEKNLPLYHFSLGRSGATGFGLTVVAPKFSSTLTLSQTGVADFALPLVQKLAAFNKPKRKNDLPTFL